MSRRPPERPTWEQVQAMIDAARAAGTYNDHYQTVCEGCRQWCDGHYVGKLGRCCVYTKAELEMIEQIRREAAARTAAPAVEPPEGLKARYEPWQS